MAHTPTREAPARWDELGAGHTETVLARVDNKTARQARWYLSRCKPYHFHDTSPTARIRGEVLARDDRYIRTDGANLAAYLHRLRTSNAAAYRRIVLTIRQIAPFFDDFELAPADDKTVTLAWHDVAREYLLSPLQFSDGTLRSIDREPLGAAPSQLDLLCESDAQRRALHGLTQAVAGLAPEAIDGGDATHPARRIADVFPRYAKPTDGNVVLSLIGLPTLLHRLPRFAAWVARLTTLAAT